MLSPKSVERDFIAVEKYNLFPQAKLHTQWPGSGTVGDPIFDQFMAETLPAIGDSKVREAVNRDATIALLDRIGPSILMPHSQSAAPVWLVADARPQLVKALLMVEAGTSLFYDVKLVGPPHRFEDGPLTKPFGLTYAPITVDRRRTGTPFGEQVSHWKHAGCSVLGGGPSSAPMEPHPKRCFLQIIKAL